MAQHTQTVVVNLSAEQVFDIVADVERYPEFLPSWQRATICDRSADGYDTDQLVGMGMFAHRFHTHTALDRPHTIAITSSDSVFERFDIHWQFEPVAEGCRIAFMLDFVVRSWLLAPALDMVLIPTAGAMVAAFQRRAELLSGSGAAAA